MKKITSNMEKKNQHRTIRKKSEKEGDDKNRDYEIEDQEPYKPTDMM